MLTGQTIDPVDAYWAFFFGGLPNPIPEAALGKLGAEVLWGASGNTAQYTLSSLAKGEALSSNDVAWAATGGALASGAGQGFERMGLEATSIAFEGTPAHNLLRGLTMSTAPLAGDVLSEATTNFAQNDTKYMIEQLEVTLIRYLYRDYHKGGHRGPIHHNMMEVD